MRPARLLVVAAVFSARTVIVTAQDGTIEGVSALARGDVQRAVEILQPLAERWRAPDPTAQFFMATLYESGRGVPVDPLRACALFEAAIRGGSPFTEQARLLHGRLLASHDHDWNGQCSLMAELGFNHHFEPVTFTLGPAHTVAWNLSSATVTYQGTSTRIPLGVATRGAVYLPLRHTRLATNGLQPESHDYIELFVWRPSGDKWNLQWLLYEVVQVNLSVVASESAIATVTAAEPPAATSFDARALVDLHVNQHGAAEYAIRGGARLRTQLIASEAERQATRDDGARARARAAADALVDWTLVRDPHRQPSMAYVDADGCGNVLLYGWSEDRTELVTFRVDEGALHLPRKTPSTFEIGDRRRSFSVSIHVYDRPLRPALCSDARVPSPPGELWHAVAGTVTIEVSPRNIRTQAPDLYFATVRITNARFVNDSRGTVRQTQPITLSAMVGLTNLR